MGTTVMSTAVWPAGIVTASPLRDSPFTNRS